MREAAGATACAHEVTLATSAGGESSARLLASLSLNAFLRVVHYVATVAVSFILAPFILHHLGAQHYGAWLFFVQAAGYLDLLDIGMRGSLARFVAQASAMRSSERLGSLITGACIALSGLAALVLGVGIWIAWFVPQRSEVPPELRHTGAVALMILAVSGARGMVGSIPGGILNGHDRYDLSTVGRLFSLGLRAGGVLYFISHGYGIVALAVITLLANLANDLSDLVFCAALRSRLSLDFGRPSKAIIIEVLKYSIPLAALQLLWLDYQTDNVIVGFLFAPALVAYYSVGALMIENLRQLGFSVVGIILPTMTRLHTRGTRRQLGEMFILSTYVWTAVFWPLMIAVFILGPRFVGIWMSPSFVEPTGRVLRILAIGYFVALPMMPGVQVILAASRHPAGIAVEAIGAIANVALSIVLAKRYGLDGVALGSTIPMLISITVFWIPYSCRLAGVSSVDLVRRALFPALVTSLPFAAALLALASLVTPNSYAHLTLIAVGAGICWIPGAAIQTFTQERALSGALAPAKVA